MQNLNLAQRFLDYSTFFPGNEKSRKYSGTFEAFVPENDCSNERLASLFDD